jgi:hypothetical protein
MSPAAREQLLRWREREWCADMLAQMWEDREVKARKLGFGPLASNGPAKRANLSALPPPTVSVMHLLLD